MLDSGQYVTYNTVLSGGKGAFAVNIVASDGTVVNSMTSASDGTITFGAILPPAGSDSYDVVGIDEGQTTPYPFNSVSNVLRVFASPSEKLALAPSNVVAYGTTVTANALSNGGTGSFSFGWTLGGANAVNSPVGTDESSNTLGVTAVGNYVYSVVSNDIGTTTPYLLGPVSNTLSIQKASLTGTITISGQTILVNGQNTVSGQSPWYFYIDNSLNGTTPSQLSVSTASFASGSYSLMLVNPGNQNYTNYTTSATLLIAPPSGTGGGSGGGGGGGGSGGVSRPLLLKTSNGFVVTNIAGLNMFNATLCGVRFNFTQNYIAWSGSGITINNQNYLLSPNSTVVLNQTENPDCVARLHVLNTTMLPIQSTLSLSLTSSPKIIPVNVTEQNFTIDLLTSSSVPRVINLLGEQTTLNITSSSTANQVLSVRNMTSSLFLPSLPAGYQKQLIQNISVSPADGMSYNQANTTVNVTIRYNCSVAFYKVIPFILSNESWSSITTYTVKPKECSLNSDVAADPNRHGHIHGTRAEHDDLVRDHHRDSFVHHHHKVLRLPVRHAALLRLWCRHNCAGGRCDACIPQEEEAHRGAKAQGGGGGECALPRGPKEDEEGARGVEVEGGAQALGGKPQKQEEREQGAILVKEGFRQKQIAEMIGVQA